MDDMVPFIYLNETTSHPLDRYEDIYIWREIEFVKTT